jgi:hypothetical protein
MVKELLIILGWDYASADNLRGTGIRTGTEGRGQGWMKDKIGVNEWSYDDIMT